MLSYDVVIVGAGPAGLKAAEILAKNNKKVIVLEKNKKIGQKVCAGGITLKDLEYIPSSLIEKSFKSVKLVSPLQNRIVKKEKPFVFTISREKLGEYQEKNALMAGAIIKMNTLVKEIDKDHIKIGNKKIRYKYLIGADGSNSIVRKYLGLKSKDVAFTIQYKLNKKFDNVEFHFNEKYFKQWYLWIFPHKDCSFVGGGIHIKDAKKLKTSIHSYLDEKKITFKEEKIESAIINGDYRGHEFSNIFLVGDAAGLATPWTGEGIYQAIVSGEEVAKKILDKNFRYKKIPSIIKINDKQKRIIKILYRKNLLTKILIEIFLLFMRFKFFQNKIFSFLDIPINHKFS